VDAEELVLWRKRRLYHRSAWGRGHPREKPAVDGGFGVSAGKLVGIKDDPGPMREHRGVPGPNHTEGGYDRF